MPGRDPNAIASKPLRITLSSESFRLLRELASRGIYGRTEAEVAARFVDQALEKFVELPKLTLKGE
jgi:hypothetical protein